MNEIIDLIAMLNKGREPVEVKIVRVVRMSKFDVGIGAIPYVVPVLRNVGRFFAGGGVVLQEKLDALLSGDAERINVWCESYVDLADAGIAFEGKMKFQRDSPLLTGLRGVVESNDGLFAAVDAGAVEKAVNGNMKYFAVSPSETVKYGLKKQARQEVVRDVVLLRYAKPKYIELSADQFASVDAKVLKRSDFVYNEDMKKGEVVKGKNVVYPVYKVLYSDSLFVPLVDETFKYAKQRYDYDVNFGVYLPSEPVGNAELRALCAWGLGHRSRLSANYISIGDPDSRSVGAASTVSESAAGGEKK